MSRSLAVLALCLAAPAAAEELAVPSGQELAFQEFILEPDNDTARFRFVAPDIDTFGFEALADDFLFLCETMAMPALENSSVSVTHIVISLAAEPVPFGEPAPDVTQFFEQFQLEDGACIWEYF